MEHEVDVLMGDVNLSFFTVIPELRSRGATIDLAAGYPWKNKLGIPSADSGGIFCLRKPGVYQLKVGLEDLHDKDKTGFLWVSSFPGATASPAVADESDEDAPVERYDIHGANGGPGQMMSCYLPNQADVWTNFLLPYPRRTLVPQWYRKFIQRRARGNKERCSGC